MVDTKSLLTDTASKINYIALSASLIDFKRLQRLADVTVAGWQMSANHLLIYVRPLILCNVIENW